MRIEIVNNSTNGTQKININDGSALLDHDNHLYIRKFCGESLIACMKTNKPHKMEAHRDCVTVVFNEKNPFVFSTDYFSSEFGNLTLSTFGDL